MIIESSSDEEDYNIIRKKPKYKERVKRYREMIVKATDSEESSEFQLNNKMSAKAIKKIKKGHNSMLI